MKLKIICDNRIFDKGNRNLKASWGLSIYIKNVLNILFDTGEDGAVLLNNLKNLSVRIEDIDLIVISHEDYDHIGGLAAVLSEKSDLKLFLPKRFPDELKARLSNCTSELIEIDGFEKIAPNLYTTGSLGSDIPEQSLILRTDQGLVVLTGCAHPGIVNILKEVIKNLPGNIFLVIGGFHLMGEGHKRMKNIISDFKKLGVEKVAPAHCTGFEAIKLFEEEYKSDFIKAGVGKEIEIKG
jgi:7,8-dihydropterin-6-yl-methyl-4-(beta-D-ribofuranosyl)aminobenzene 5'-phosphate synthase